MRSRADGDRHYIGVDALLRLYSVPPDARRVVADDHGRLPLGMYASVCDVHLYPRSDDRYQPVVAPPRPVAGIMRYGAKLENYEVWFPSHRLDPGQ